MLKPLSFSSNRLSFFVKQFDDRSLYLLDNLPFNLERISNKILNAKEKLRGFYSFDAYAFKITGTESYLITLHNDKLTTSYFWSPSHPNQVLSASSYWANVAKSWFDLDKKWDAAFGKKHDNPTEKKWKLELDKISLQQTELEKIIELKCRAFPVSL